MPKRHPPGPSAKSAPGTPASQNSSTRSATSNTISRKGLQRIVAENTTLKQQGRQLTQDKQHIQERLASARQNNRFLDKHIADLEAQLAPYLTAPPPPEL
jgi:cell division protein FtsB